MNTIIYESRNKRGSVISRARLSTESPASHYGIPVLEIEHGGESRTFGWADVLPSGLTGADFVRKVPGHPTNFIADSPERQTAIKAALDNIEAMSL